MSQERTLSLAPRVIFRSTPSGYVLESERTAKLSRFMIGKSTALVKTLLTSLLGLCPVAHHEAFAVACEARPSSASYQWLAVEAMLESVRVFCVDWQRFVPSVRIEQATLEQLGRLRQRLLGGVLQGRVTMAESLLKETQAFVRQFQTENRLLLKALMQRAEVFDTLPPISSQIWLPSATAQASATMRYWLSELIYDREFATRPQLHGARLVGSLARTLDPQRTPNWQIASLLEARWMELSVWSYSEALLKQTFEPVVRTFEDGWQVCVAESLRGSLLHAVKLEDGVVKDFHIMAPTEWAFQANGWVSTLLNRWVADTYHDAKIDLDDLKFLVALFDACTDIRFEEDDKHA